MEKQKKSKKKVLLIIAVVVIVIILLFALLLVGDDNKLNVDNHEPVAYTSLRLAIATSQVDGTDTLDSDYLDVLQALVKRVDSNNQWFSKNTGTFYGGTADTSDEEVTWLCDGTYCAIFYIENTGTDYYLLNYSFSADDTQGAIIFVE